MTPDEEMALISDILDSKPSRFDELVRAHQDGLFRFLLGMLRNHHDAEEVTQETFLSAYKHLGRFEGRSSFGTWLRRIAHNLAIDRQRRKRLGKQHVDQVVENDVVDVSGDPSEQVLAGESRTLVWKCIETLATEHRQILLMREIHGMDYSEIAGELGLPIGTVRSRLHRARCELRQSLLIQDPTLLAAPSVVSLSSEEASS